MCTLQQCPQIPIPHSPATKHTELPTAPHMLQLNTPPVVTANAGSTHLATSHAPLVISTQANSAIWHEVYIGPHIHTQSMCVRLPHTIHAPHTLREHPTQVAFTAQDEAALGLKLFPTSGEPHHTCGFPGGTAEVHCLSLFLQSTLLLQHGFTHASSRG